MTVFRKKTRDDWGSMFATQPRADATAASVREEHEHYHATRPCPRCQKPMKKGRCKEHGMPAEDRGPWWGGDAA